MFNGKVCGKDILYNTLIYGYRVDSKNDCFIVNMDDSGNIISRNRVHKSSIENCTGFIDKNKIEIYENQKIKFKSYSEDNKFYEGKVVWGIGAESIASWWILSKEEDDVFHERLLSQFLPEDLEIIVTQEEMDEVWDIPIMSPEIREQIKNNIKRN